MKNFLKLTGIALVAVIVFSMTACNETEDPPVDLTGTWTGTPLDRGDGTVTWTDDPTNNASLSYFKSIYNFSGGTPSYTLTITFGANNAVTADIRTSGSNYFLVTSFGSDQYRYQVDSSNNVTFQVKGNNTSNQWVNYSGSVPSMQSTGPTYSCYKGISGKLSETGTLYIYLTLTDGAASITHRFSFQKTS